MDAVSETTPSSPKPIGERGFLPPIEIGSDLGMYSLAPRGATLLDTATGRSITPDTQRQQIMSMWQAVGDYYDSTLPDAIYKGLDDPQRRVGSHSLVKLIDFLPQKQQPRLRSHLSDILNRSLDADDPDNRLDLWSVTESIASASKEQIPALVQKVIDDPKCNDDLIFGVIISIYSMPPDVIIDVIREIVDNPRIDEDDKKRAINDAFFAPTENAEEYIAELRGSRKTRKYVKDLDIHELRDYANNRKSRRDGGEVAREKLTFPDWPNQLPTDAELDHSTPLPVQSPLHQVAKEDAVVEFDKGGSELFALPKDTEALVHIIPATAFKAWMTAYLSPAQWREAGFDYVPIEPIVNFKPDDQDPFMVQVTTTNLRGVSLDSIIKDKIEGKKPDIDIDIDELQRRRSKIVATLNKLGIRHNHPHGGNLVLVPHTSTDDGTAGHKVNLEQVRAYLIDFDEAATQPNAA